jgi:hypothetical protein
LEAVAARGYFDGQEILTCEDARIAVPLPNVRFRVGTVHAMRAIRHTDLASRRSFATDDEAAPA